MNPLQQAHALGHSIWLDGMNLQTSAHGKFARLIAEGVRGVTTGRQTPVEEACRIADLLQPLYAHTRGHDGFVSLEMQEDPAQDAAGTVRAATRLWQSADRRNVMIAVPGTPVGLVAAEELIASGINVNVTLLYSPRGCAEARAAYCRGLERLNCTATPGEVASVASFFLSRVDIAVDRQLDRLGTAQAHSLCGQAAIACARVAYHDFLTDAVSSRWEKLRWVGARPQRLLWVSGSANHPAYRDLKYVEALIAAQTVAALPRATLDTFGLYGHVQSMNAQLDQEQDVLEALDRLGINLEQVTEEQPRPSR